MLIHPVRRFMRAAMITLVLIFAANFACAADAEPALWKIEGANATVYLFGTVHALKPEQVWRTAQIDAAIRASNALWLEVPDADDPSAMQPLIMTYGLDQAHPLSSKIDAQTKADFDKFLKPLGVAPAQMEPLRPWMAGLTISTLPLIKAGYDPDKGVEHVIKQEMQAAGKPVFGFETTEQQIRYLAETPPETEIEFFKSSLSEGQRALSILDDLVLAWSAGDTNKLEYLLNGELKDKYPDLYRRFIAERNVRFADQIAKLADGHGVLFVAVGAAHLVGPDSVLSDLAKRGLQAARQ